MTIRRMFGAITLVVSMATMVGGQEPGAPFFLAADVVRTHSYNCSGTLVGIEHIGPNLYLACFETGSGALGGKDFSFLAYDVANRRISNAIEIQGSLSYRIMKIEGRDMFLLVFGNEIANNRLVAFDGNALVVLQTYDDADIVAAGEDLIGMAIYDPAYAGRIIQGSNAPYGVLPVPGPFADCELLAEDSRGGVLYLCRDFAVVSIADGAEQVVRSITPDCTTSWTAHLSLFSHLIGAGYLGDELVGVINGANGTVGLALRSGAPVDLGAEGQSIFHPAFLDHRLTYPIRKSSGAAGGVGEFELRSIGIDPADAVNIPLPMGKPPLALSASHGHLNCFYDASQEYPEGMTVIYGPGFSSAKVLRGCWMVIEDVNGVAEVLGGDRRAGILEIGTVSLSVQDR